MNSLTAKQILEINNPGELFTGNLNIAKEEYRKLLKTWHPDINHSSDSEEVSKHIFNLYQNAVMQLEAGKWETPGLLELESGSNKYRIRYKKKFKFELGDTYIGEAIIVYILDSTNKDLFSNFNTKINSFKYASERMKTEFSKCVPTVLRTFVLEDKIVIILKKSPDLFRLRDVFNYYNNMIPPRHVAWIMSTLHNLVCYLEFTGISHNDISLDTFFISPPFHNGSLLGGWWYSSFIGDKITAVPNRTYQIMPTSVKRNKIASIKTDLESIRAIGRELLGDVSGIRLKQNTDIPKPIISWLQLPSPTGSPIEDYKLWNEVLKESYGPKKFVEMKIEPDSLY